MFDAKTKNTEYMFVSEAKDPQQWERDLIKFISKCGPHVNVIYYQGQTYDHQKVFNRNISETDVPVYDGPSRLALIAANVAARCKGALVQRPIGRPGDIDRVYQYMIQTQA
jgi:hypothetical protein